MQSSECFDSASQSPRHGNFLPVRKLLRPHHKSFRLWHVLKWRCHRACRSIEGREWHLAKYLDHCWFLLKCVIKQIGKLVDGTLLIDGRMRIPKAIVIAPDMARPWRSLRSPLMAVKYPTLSSVFLLLPSTNAGELMKRMNATRTREKACSVAMAP